VGRWPVRYRAAGSGPPVVLVHGLGVSADYWWRVGPPLAAAGHRVLAPDLPGFGRTPGPRGGLSIFDQADAVLSWSDALGLESAVMVGHSLSCQALLELAAGRPERVRALVLAAPTGAPHRFPLLRQAVGLLRDIPRESLPLAAFAAQAYLRAGPWRLWRSWRMGADEDPLAAAHRVRAPTLVLVGRRDPVVPRSFAEELTAALPRGRLAWVEGAAHALVFDGAEGVVGRIVEWMESEVVSG
jgi:pimeloyl-ACP methyl ester carboxylesterase